MNDHLTSDTFGVLRRELRDTRSIVARVDHNMRRVLDGGGSGPSPRSILTRVVACHVLAARQRTQAARVCAEIFNNDPTVLAGLARPGAICKAAMTPAQTNVSGWAAELTAAVRVGALQTLAPSSVYSQLSQRPSSMRLSLQGVGTARVPSRSLPTSAPNPFVGEGQPASVRKGFLNGAILSPRKATVLAAFTEEMVKFIPNIEQIVTAVLEADVASGIDGVLLSAVAADTVRPAGLLAGVTATPAAIGGGLQALSGDIRALSAAISASGALLDPVLVMSSTNALLVGLLSMGAADDLPLITAPTVPAGRLIMLDAADFASAEGDNLDLSASMTAAIHEEDTLPLPLVGGIVQPPAIGSVAAPVRSMFQTACVALRLIQDLGWTMTRSGRIAFIDAVTW